MRNEKSLVRYREEQNLGESDLSSSGFVRIQSDREHQTNFFRWICQVILHCANMFAKCGMNTEAMNQYNYILKNKLLPVPNRLYVKTNWLHRSLLMLCRRINIGNIYLHSKQYAKALKMYRMALDQIPEQNADLK